MLSLEGSKFATGTRFFASLINSARSRPAGSASTPLPSIMATVLSELSKISSAPSSTFISAWSTNGSTHLSRDLHLAQRVVRWRRNPKRGRTLTWPTGLHLRDILLAQPELFVDTQYILADRQGCHAVRVVGHPAELLCTLASCERLPPRFGSAFTCMV